MCQVTSGVIGGHAFGAARAVHEPAGLPVFVVDGEVSVYRFAADHARGVGVKLFRFGSDGFTLGGHCTGNVAVWDAVSGSLWLAAHFLGSFPLYYVHVPGGFLFSSLLRPLLKAMACVTPVEPDMVGVVQWLRRGCYFLGNRTFFAGVRRLLPGQVLSFRAHGRHATTTIEETSDLCAGGYDESAKTLNDAADGCWERLVKAVAHSADEGKIALMMSAGWDSRVLLAAIRTVFDSDRLFCYSHGDPESRELRVVRDICGRAGVRFRLESSENAFDPAGFDTAFARAESLVFPEWQHAGRVLATMGVQDVLTGVYGAIVGGEQGADQLERGYRKIPVLLKELAGGAFTKEYHRIPDIGILRRALSVGELQKPWYLLEEVWRAMPPAHESINADLESDFERLKARNIEHQDQLLEAFLVESQQTQYEAGQIVSCRAFVDVSLPYGNHVLVRLAGRIPWSIKYHRTLMRRMLQRHAADLLDFPMAATLVPVRAPVAVQKVSRLLQRFGEQICWGL